jgi:hypothetical protein
MVMLWIIGRRVQPGPWKFLWLLPARSWTHALWLATLAFFQVRPFEATAVLGVPFLTVIMIVVWVIGRVAQYKR